MRDCTYEWNRACARKRGHALCEVLGSSIILLSAFSQRGREKVEWCLSKSVTGSRWCNGAALPWVFWLSRQPANWGLSGVSGKNTWGFCAAVSPVMERGNLVRIRRKQESAFTSNQQSLLNHLLDVWKKKNLCSICSYLQLWFSGWLKHTAISAWLQKAGGAVKNVNTLIVSVWICSTRPSQHSFSNDEKDQIILAYPVSCFSFLFLFDSSFYSAVHSCLFHHLV